MREILFRGKRNDNEEWVYGCLMHPEFFVNDMPCIVWSSDNDASVAEVNPATVGQYTGLKDKNGTRIFEGDMLKISKRSDSLGTHFSPPIDYPHNVIVRWDMCAWLWEVIGKDKYYIQFPDAWCHYGCEIIGNVHDNSELLDGAGA